MRRRFFAASGLLVASLATAPAALGFSGISNGSFESGTYPGGPWITLHPGSTVLDGWTIDSGSVDWTGPYWLASNGSLSIDLSGDGPGAISQTLSTVVGNTYTVSFDLSGNPACGPVLKTMTVSATGVSGTDFTYDVSAAQNSFGDMKWVNHTVSFVATATSTTLTFTSTTGTSCGPALDNVVVAETVPTPEPPPAAQPASIVDCKGDRWVTLVDAAENPFKNQGDCVSYVATAGRNAAAVTVKSPAHAVARADTPSAQRAKDHVTSGRIHDAAPPRKRGGKPRSPTHERTLPAAVSSTHGPSR